MTKPDHLTDTECELMEPIFADSMIRFLIATHYFIMKKFIF